MNGVPKKENKGRRVQLLCGLLILCSGPGTLVYGQTASNMVITAAAGPQQAMIAMGAGYTQDPQNYSSMPSATRLAMASLIWGTNGLGFRACRLWQNDAGTLTGAQMLSDYLQLYNDINSVQTNMIWEYAAWGAPSNSPSSLNAYAAFHAQVIANCKAGGLVFQAVGTCNEPNGSTPFLYQSTNAALLVEDFRTNLYNLGLTNVQIISPESPNVDSTGMGYITNIEKAPAALADLAAFCSHSYNMSFTPAYYTLCNVPGKQSWQDESGANGPEDTNWTGTNAINDESLAVGCVARACNDFNFGCEVWMHFEACLQWDTNDNATRIMGYDPNTFAYQPFLKYYYYQQFRRAFKDGCVFRRSTSSDTREAVYEEMCLTYGDRPAIVGAAGQNPDGSWGLNVANITGYPDIRPGVSAGSANYQPAATYNITYQVAELTNAGTVSFNLYRSNTNDLDVYQGTVLMTNGSVAFTIAPLELVTLVSAPTNSAGNVIKANNTANLDLGSSWVGGTAPTAIDIAIWDSTVTGANNVSLGGNVTFGGICLSNVGGAVAIAPGNTLTLGAGGINLSNASANLTLNCALALGAPHVWAAGPGVTLTVGGPVANGGNGLTIAGAGNTVVNGDITGSGGLTNAAGGTVTLTATNGYTGGTTVNAGTLVLPPGANGVGIICGPLTINSNAQVNADTGWALGWSGTNGVTSITIHGGTLELTGTAGTGGLEASNVTLCAGSITGNTFDWYGGLYEGLATGPVLATVASTTASVISSGFNLGSGAGLNLTLNVAAGPTTNGVDLLISGPISNSFGGGGVTKVGSGTVVLSGADTCTEPTVVSNGTLLVNNALGPGAVAVDGGTLGGMGAISGPVTINAGGALSLGGAGIGTLAISNTLALNAGGACFMRISKTGGAATNDTVVGLGTLSYGGTLTVTNLGGTLAAGDVFQLFSAASYTGNFAAMNLPPIGWLAWSWTPSNGTLTVVGTLAPTNAVGSVIKADNTANLDLGSSWVGGVAPTTTNVAVWDSTVTDANTVSLGGNMIWGGISIENVGGGVTIAPGNALTLGAGGINLSNAFANLTLNCALALGAPQGWAAGSGVTLTVGGPVANGGNGLTIAGAGNTVVNGDITGSGGLTNAASGTVTLIATNGYSGGTIANAGTLVLLPGVNGTGTICGSLTINSNAQVNADTDWALGWNGTNGVTSIAINGGTLDLTGAAGSGGLQAGNVTLCAGSITGNMFDWYGGFYEGLATGPVLATVASATASVISSGFNLGLGTGINLTLNVAAGATTNGVDLLISGPMSNSFGGGGVTKVGAGTVVLSGADTCTEPSVVSDGTLLVDGAVGPGAVTVDGGTLGGVGAISGPVTINAGGALSLGGASIGTLTISNTLTLNAGGACFMRISKAGGIAANDAVAGLGTLTYGGTLTVTNLGGTLAAGDVFQLFSAVSYAGNFAATNLPALGSGLAWSWTPVSGTLAVVATGPMITGVSALASGGIGLTFSGPPGDSYSICTTTNLALPLSNWAVITTGVFGEGLVSYQDATATNYPTRFYELVVP